MKQTEVFVRRLQEATGKASFPVKFWEAYPESHTHTFQDVLSKYAEYDAVLKPAQKKAISLVFWNIVEEIGTPIIEDSLTVEGKCDVYFLFPKNKVSEGKDLYLQGDVHGYDTTDGRQQVNEFSQTGIMLHQDAIARDAIITYRYIQLEHALYGKTPTEHHGSVLVETPPDIFFPSEDALATEVVISPQTENASDVFWGADSQLSDEYSKHRFSFPGSPERLFRVNANLERSHLSSTPVDWSQLLSENNPAAKHFILHDVLYSDVDGNLHQCIDSFTGEQATPGRLFPKNPDDAPPFDDFTRVIHVFKPTSGVIDDVVLVNDGIPYLATGAMESFEKMVETQQLSPHTAFVFVNYLPGLAKTMNPDDPTASMPGMGARTIDYKHGIKQYADFIKTKLFPQLSTRDFQIPEDSNHRVMVGSSLSGTASLYMAHVHPTLFGGVIAQSPSPNNRDILAPTVAGFTPLESRADILMSCGDFEQLTGAANTNLPYARELSTKLRVPLKEEAHGHQFLPWIEALETALPQSFENIHLQGLIQEHDVVGASVAVLDNGRVHCTSAGKLVIGGKKALSYDAVFEAASLSKPVFAYIVLKMVERGELDLDVPLCDLSQNGFGPPHLRETPEYQQLTARMILSHQTGLPNWMPEAFQADPQTQFNYSGLAYCFLCDVIQEISEQSLEQLAKRELEPLGIVQSAYFYQPEDDSAEKQRFTVGHNATGTPDERSHYPRASEKNDKGISYLANPAASLFMTTENFAKFLEACVTDEFIREHMFARANDLGHGRDSKAIQEGVSSEVLEKLHWGLGMGIQENEDGSMTAFHWGDSETFRNLTAIRLEQDGAYKGVVCFTNSMNGPAIFRQVAEPVVGSITPVATWLSKREKLPVSVNVSTRNEDVVHNAARTQTMRVAISEMKSDGNDDVTHSPK